jgi:hypothetical protein
MDKLPSYTSFSEFEGPYYETDLVTQNGYFQDYLKQD